MELPSPNHLLSKGSQFPYLFLVRTGLPGRFGWLWDNQRSLSVMSFSIKCEILGEGRGATPAAHGHYKIELSRFKSPAV